MAKRTWSTYSRGLTQFQQFRQEARLPLSWPAPENHIVSFIAYLSLVGLSPATIGTYLAAVAYAHKVHGLPDPTDHFLVHKIREGLRRESHKSDVRYPVTENLLLRLSKTVGGIATSEFEANLFKAAFQLAFFGLLRVGEFTTPVKIW